MIGWLVARAVFHRIRHGAPRSVFGQMQRPLLALTGFSMVRCGCGAHATISHGVIEPIGNALSCPILRMSIAIRRRRIPRAAVVRT
jgi:hypothetical protein